MRLTGAIESRKPTVRFRLTSTNNNNNMKITNHLCNMPSQQQQPTISTKIPSYQPDKNHNYIRVVKNYADNISPWRNCPVTSQDLGRITHRRSWLNTTFTTARPICISSGVPHPTRQIKSRVLGVSLHALQPKNKFTKIWLTRDNSLWKYLHKIINSYTVLWKEYLTHQLHQDVNIIHLLPLTPFPFTWGRIQAIHARFLGWITFAELEPPAGWQEGRVA